MAVVHFMDAKKYPEKKGIALLLKRPSYREYEIRTHYVEPLVKLGVPEENILCITLPYDKPKRVTAKFAKEHLEDALEEARKLKVSHLIVGDGFYAKFAFKVPSINSRAWIYKPCPWEGYEDISLSAIPSYAALMYNPEYQENISDILGKFAERYKHGVLVTDPPIKNAYYAFTPDVSEYFKALEDMPVLTCDIETDGLTVSSSLVSIAFAWNRRSAVGFFMLTDWKPIHKKLKKFLQDYKGKLIFHNAIFDIKLLVANLFMEHPGDYGGMLEGIEILTRDIEDTMLLTYLATNSTNRGSLSLKQNVLEFAGDYALENIGNIMSRTPREVLDYNMTDAGATWYLYKKMYPRVIKDNQLKIYREIFLPMVPVIVNMELVGMPLDISALDKTKDKLTNLISNYYNLLNQESIIEEWSKEKTLEFFLKRTHTLKKKVPSLSECRVAFNPASNNDVQSLLYDKLGLPIIAKTKEGNPSTQKETLEALCQKLIQEHQLTEEEIKLDKIL